MWDVRADDSISNLEVSYLLLDESDMEVVMFAYDGEEKRLILFPLITGLRERIRTLEQRILFFNNCITLS